MQDLFGLLIVGVGLIIFIFAFLKVQKLNSKKGHVTPKNLDKSELQDSALNEQGYLYFKDTEAAFEIACKYMDTSLVKKRPTLGLIKQSVEDVPAIFTTPEGMPFITLKYPNDKGGEFAITTIDRKYLDFVKDGDLVFWVPLELKSGNIWTGLITAKIKPAHHPTTGMWLIEKIFN